MKTVETPLRFMMVIIGCCMLSGCFKTLEDYRKAQQTPTRLLCDRSWIQTSEMHSPPNIIPNVFASYQPCAKDNEYRYEEDGYYELNQGDLKCYSTQPAVIEQGNWAFLQKETQLKIEVGSTRKTRVYNILLLDTNHHLITTYIDSSTGTKVTVKEEFIQH